jgi:YD repeat-containing protein
MNPTPKQKAHRRRVIARVLAFIYILSTSVQWSSAVAGPQLFARPGAGVSRMNVTQFNAPGYGEVEDAINLANGNVYVQTDQVSRNNKLTGTDEKEKTINNGGWNTTPRMRLFGFSGNRITNQDVTDNSYWGGYWSKPSSTAYRLASSDGGCGANVSGVLRTEPADVPNGTYRVSLEVRTVAGTAQLFYGMNDIVGAWVTINDKWQSLSTDFVWSITAATPTYLRQRLMQINEATTNNPAWDIANLSVRKFDSATNTWGVNLLATQDVKNPYWGGYCVNPVITPVNSGRLLSTDYPAAPAQGISGLIRSDPANPMPNGKYVVTFEGRTLNGSLPILFGISDYAFTFETLNPKWQVYSAEFTLTDSALQRERQFEIREDVLNNPSWEVRNIQVRSKTVNVTGYTLGVGDGSNVTFDRVDSIPNLAWFNDKPSWINRYKGSSESAPLLASTKLYRSRPLNGTQYSEEWIAAITRADGTVIAQYYAPDGTRTTFDGDGEYADYIQNLSQQYRAAVAGYSEGIDPTRTTARTELEYVALNSGKMLKVRDEYGRTNAYDWVGEDLMAINYLLRVPTDNATWIRRTEFGYGNINTPWGMQRVITAEASRYLSGKSLLYADSGLYKYNDFTYEVGQNTLRLKAVLRYTKGGTTSSINTIYTYDDSNPDLSKKDRVTRVDQSSTGGQIPEPSITYAYNTTTDYPGGSQVTVTQGNKKSDYFIDTRSRLRKKVVLDFNPQTNVQSNLVWKYEYYNTGNVALVIEPTGKTTHMAYDTKGNLVRSAVYATNPLAANYVAPIELGLKTTNDAYVYARGDMAFFEVSMLNDVTNAGLKWELSDGAGNNFYQFTPTGTIAYDPITAKTTQTTNFNVGTTLGNKFTVRVTSLKDSSKTASASFVVDRKIGSLESYYSDKIIVAPNCSQAEGSTVCGPDPSKFPTQSARDKMQAQLNALGANPTAIDLSGQAVATQNFTGQINNAVKWSAPISWNITPLPSGWSSDTAWLNSVLGTIDANNRWNFTYQSALAGREIQATIRVSSVQEPDFYQDKIVTLKYFGLAFPNSSDQLPGIANIWKSNAATPYSVNDETTFQLGVRAINQPFAGVDLTKAQNPVKIIWDYSPRIPGNPNIPGVTGVTDNSSYPGKADALLRGEYSAPWAATRAGTLNQAGCVQTPGLGHWGFILGEGKEWTRDITISATLANNTSVKIERKLTISFDDPQVNDTCPLNTRLPNTSQYVNDNGLITDVAGTSDLVARPLSIVQARGLQQASTGYVVADKTDVAYVATAGTCPTCGADALLEVQEPEPSSAYVAGYKTLQVMSYDNDNRLTSSFMPGWSGTAGGLSHSYQGLEQKINYGTNGFNTQTANGQKFETNGLVQQITNIGGTLTSTPGNPSGFSVTGGTLARYNDTWIGNDARVAQSFLYWAASAKSRTLSYSYWTGTEELIPQPSGTTQFKAMQWADQVKGISTTTNDVSSTVTGNVSQKDEHFYYDALGNVVWQDIEGVASNLTGTQDPTTKLYSAITPTKTLLVTESTYNGLGQKTWEKKSLGGNIASEKGWTYLGGGELVNEWSGTKKNLTTYEYDSLDRVTTIKHGIGDGTITNSSAVLTPHSTQTINYDEFSRRNLMKETGTIETAGTNWYYDTLDRVVIEDRPDGSRTRTEYGISGQTTRLENVGKSVTTIARDIYGRATSQVVTPSTGTGITTVMDYDVFDRVLAITTSDAGTGTASISPTDTDRVSVMQYDTEGRVILELGPVLRGDSTFTDARRTATSYEYDGLGRKVKVNKRLYGTGNTVTAGVNTATTTTEYDGFDNPVKETDANGFVTERGFDAAGQIFQIRRQNWKGTEDAVARGTGAATDRVNIWQAYDAVGHVIKMVDPVGGMIQEKYNTAGNKTAEINALGFLSKGYTYTDDQLQEGIWSPKVTDGTVLNVFNPDAPDAAKFVKLQAFEYDSRSYPARIRKAFMNDVPGVGTGGALASFTYDYAGRNLTTTLPAAGTPAVTSTITKAYDGDGNVISSTDADGFSSTTTFDYRGKVLSQKQNARSGSAVDTSAGLGAGIETSNVYDGYGNLIKKTEGGLITEFRYNTLGKVVAESRPYKTGAAITWKRFAYRLDGSTLASTNYSYAGNFPTAPTAAPVANEGASLVTAGNLQMFNLDPLGNATEETSFGQLSKPASYTDPLYDTSLVRKEKRLTSVYNGLGLKVARTLLEGDPVIYAPQRDDNGMYIRTGGLAATSNPGAPNISVKYSTYAKYNARGQLLEMWDANDAVAKFNSFVYTYTATGKEKTATRDVRIKISPLLPDAALGSSVMLAASKGTITNYYYEDDTFYKSLTQDQDASGINALNPTFKTRFTRYNHYLDGSKSYTYIDDAAVPNLAGTAYKYDARGREIEATDTNGAIDQRADIPAVLKKNIFGNSTTPAKSTTTYKGAGVITRKVLDGNGKCYYQQDLTTSVNGLVQESREWERNPRDTSNPNIVYEDIVCGTSVADRTTTFKYDSAGNALENNVNFKNTKQFDSGKLDMTTVASQKTTMGYDVGYGLLLEQKSVLTSNTTGQYWGVRSITCTSAPVSTITNSSKSSASHTYTACSGTTDYSDATVSVPGAVDSGPNGTPNGSIEPEEYGHVEVTNVAISIVPNYDMLSYGANETKVVTVTSGYDNNNAEISRSQTTVDATPGNSATACNAESKRGNYKNWQQDNVTKISQTACYQPSTLENAPKLSSTPNVVADMYVVDSRANRLRVINGKFDGYAKRYNADDKPTWFTKFDNTNNYTAHNNFVYDPSGEQILTFTGGLKQANIGAPTYQIVRDTSSVYKSTDEVQVIRRHKGKSGNLAVVAMADDYTNAANDLVKDQAFSMADGIVDEGKWLGVVPFDVPETGVISLEAPQTAFSTQVGLSPMSIVAPGNSDLPGGLNPGGVIAPSKPVELNPSNATSTPSGSTAASGSSVEAQPFGVKVENLAPTSTSSNTNSSTTTSSATTNTTTSSSQAFSSQTSLQAPISVLPPALQGLNANEITPSDAPGSSTIPGLTDPSTILPPGDVKPPSTGSTPADQPSAITPPSSSTGGALPPATATPSPVVVTKPPTSDGTVKSLETQITVGLGWTGFLAWTKQMDGAKASLEAKWKEDGRDIKANMGQFQQELFLIGAGLLRAALKKAGANSKVLTDFDDTIKFVKDWENATERFQFLYQLAAMIYNDINYVNSYPPTASVSMLVQLAGWSRIAIGKSGSEKQRIKETMFGFLHDVDYYGPRGVEERIEKNAIMIHILLGLLLIPGIIDSIVQLVTGKDWVTGKDLTQLDKILQIAGLALVVIGKAVVLVKASKNLSNLAAKEGATVSKSGSIIGCNSFSAKTKIATKVGLVAISSLIVGSTVLAYNETTHKQGEYTVTQTHKNNDPQITKLTLENSIKKLEVIETTPEHPFYLEKNADNSNRPKPIGHENLSRFWVGAGHLKVGDIVKSSTGTGLVRKIVTLEKPQEMYNLTVDKAHTFFVGDGKWLVHNVEVKCFNSFEEARKAGFSQAGIRDPKTGKYIDVEFTKYDVVRDAKGNYVEGTGTVVEFKGSNGGSVDYDGPHADMNPDTGHNLPHVGSRGPGKVKAGQGKRTNNTYPPPAGPIRRK